MSNTYALIIGINYTNTDYELENSVKSANDLKNILHSKFSVPNKNIKLLTDNLTFENPTNMVIKNNLEWLVQCSETASMVILSFCGHGFRTFDDYRGVSEVIIPHDVKNIVRDDDIFRILLQEAKCPVFCLIDTCDSGTSARLRYKYDLNNFVVTGRRNKNGNNLQHILISSIKNHDNTNFFDKNNKKFSGVLTSLFLQALEEFGDVLTYAKLLEYLNLNFRNKFFEDYMITEMFVSNIIDIKSTFLFFEHMSMRETEDKTYNSDIIIEIPEGNDTKSKMEEVKTHFKTISDENNYLRQTASYVKTLKDQIIVLQDENNILKEKLNKVLELLK